MSNEWTTLNPGANGDVMDEEGVSYGSAPLVRKRPRVVLAGSTDAEIVRPLNSAPAGAEYALPVRQVGSMPPVTIGSMPSVNVSSMPPVNIGSMPSVNVGSLPALAAGSNLIGQVTVTEQAADLCVTIQGGAGAATTLGLPLVAGKYHYIHMLELVLYNAGARTGSATPLVTTTTNLPGGPAFTWPTAGAIGTTVEKIFQPATPLRSFAAGQNTTIVGPATANVIWRFTAWYRVAT